MKVNRFVALAALALLVVGAMGAFSYGAYAQSAAPAAQAQDCAGENDANEAADATGTENDANEAADAAGTDTDDKQCGDQNEAAANNGQAVESVEDQEAAPSGTPAITAEAAQKIAEDYLNAGPASAVELDEENGKLVYGVEFKGTDVKVDAMTGEVLTVETGQD